MAAVGTLFHTVKEHKKGEQMIAHDRSHLLSCVRPWERKRALRPFFSEPGINRLFSFKPFFPSFHFDKWKGMVWRKEEMSGSREELSWPNHEFLVRWRVMSGCAFKRQSKTDPLIYYRQQSKDKERFTRARITRISGWHTGGSWRSYGRFLRNDFIRP